MEDSSSGHTRTETLKNAGAFLFFTLGAAALSAVGIELAEKDAPNTEISMFIIDVFSLGFTTGSVLEWRDLWRNQQ